MLHRADFCDLIERRRRLIVAIAPQHSFEFLNLRIRLREGADHGENHGRLLLGGVIAGPALGLVFRNWFSKFPVRDSPPKIVIGAISCDGGQPSSKTRNVAQGMELAQRRKEDFLDEVIYFTRWYARQQDAMDHASVAVVETAESGAVALAGGAHKRVIVARCRFAPSSHSLTFHACGSKVNAVAHVQNIVFTFDREAVNSLR